LSQKFLASYIKKYNTAAVSSLFFYVISADFNGFIPLFLWLMYGAYSSPVEEFILLQEKVLCSLSDVSDVIVT